jgi:hypothetical protein
MVDDDDQQNQTAKEIELDKAGRRFLHGVLIEAKRVRRRTGSARRPSDRLWEQG